MTRRLGRKVEVVLVLVAVGLASSCVSATKDANPALKRGRDGDDKKVLLDLSQIVRSKDDLPSGVSSAEQERLRNVKLNPRNYKFSCAIAPLTIDFRRVEKDPELGEPLENFSERPPLSRPVEDDEARKAAELPPEDRLAGVPLRPAEERFAQTAAPSSSTPLSTPDQPAPPRPDSSSPKEGPRPPETPAEEPEPPPRRVGALPGTTRRQFAESDSPAPVGSDSVAPTGTDATAEVATAPVVRTSSDELKKISQYEGMNFRIDANGFRKRMADVFREYLVFEHVDEIDYTSDQKTLESLFQQAEANGDDFLLVATLKRNKVSYLGTDFGGAFTDDVLWVLFWFPSEFFGFIPRESFEADVELQVKLYDVRSRFAVVDRTFEGHDRLVLTGWERGYQMLGPFTVAMTSWAYSHERLFSTAGDWVRPGAWIDMERQLLDHFYNQLKKELDKTDSPTFDDSTNRNVREKPFALVCGITKYCPDAMPKLREWAAGSADSIQQELKEQAFRKEHDGQPVDLGTIPYAEDDAKRMLELLRRRGALETGEGLTGANIDELLGENATTTRIRGALRRLAKSRREDRVFVYLNGQTLLLDDPKQPDGVSKYFLPYNVNLAKLEELRVAAAASQDPAAWEPVKSYLDENAISFDWIDDCFNKSGPQDHVYLQSRHALVLVDCAFPGACTGTRFCPKKASGIAGVGSGTGAARQGSDGALLGGELLTTGFLDRLVAGSRGRTIVLTTAPGEEPLEIPSSKLGAFAYYFTQFLDTQNRVRPKNGAFMAKDLVAYAADRIEAESRQVGRPQHILVLGERDADAVVLSGER